MDKAGARIAGGDSPVGREGCGTHPMTANFSSSSGFSRSRLGFDPGVAMRTTSAAPRSRLAAARAGADARRAPERFTRAAGAAARRVDAHARAGSATAAGAMVKADIVSIGVSPRVPWGVWVVLRWGGSAFLQGVTEDETWPNGRTSLTGGRARRVSRWELLFLFLFPRECYQLGSHNK